MSEGSALKVSGPFCPLKSKIHVRQTPCFEPLKVDEDLNFTVSIHLFFRTD